MVLLIPSHPLNAAPEDTCPICGNRMTETVYRFTQRGRDSKILICANCVTLETQCYICGLPVKRDFLRLADGRILCQEDTRAAVLTQDDAEKLFDHVKHEVQPMLAQLGALPHHNIRLILEAKARLDKTGQNLISAHDDRLLMGLTRTFASEPGRFEHTVYLLYGLTRERMMVVAAHEYAHAWLHENVRRRLNADCVEGFCDWIAYKLITQKNAPYETKVLLESEYSQGQLQAFIAAEKEHTFYRVIQWVKSGIDPAIDIEQPGRILELRPGAPRPVQPALAVIPAPAPVRVGPDHLMLKGLSGTTARRFAMINDQTFMANETGKVRVGTNNVVVRCLEIRADSVVIEANGERAELRLEHAR